MFAYKHIYIYICIVNLLGLLVSLFVTQSEILTIKLTLGKILNNRQASNIINYTKKNVQW